MVKIIGFKAPDEGQKFNKLILQGEVEFLKSPTREGQHYAVIQQCTTPCIFDTKKCKQLVGQFMEGKIEKMKCAPYEFTPTNSDEVLELDFRYYYNPKPHSMEQEIFEARPASLNW